MCDYIKKSPPYFFLQWHITPLCNLRCVHCYVRDRNTYLQELKNQLEYDDCVKVIEDFAKMINIWKFRGGIHFTGGEPFLRNDLINLIKYARKKNIEVRILSNGTLVQKELTKELYDLGVRYVQVSIDSSTKEIHDKFRGVDGALEMAKNGIRTLKENGCSPTVAVTLSKQNYHQIEEIVDLAYECGADRIGFSRLVPIGAGEQIREDMLNKNELYNAFDRIEKKRKENKIEIVKRDPLWALYHKLKAPAGYVEKGIVLGGCSIGYGGLTILSDGTVYPCRRLPIPIGKVPEDSLRDIWSESKVLWDLRDFRNLEKCSECEYVPLCRGCRAISYAIYKDYLREDPQCWKC
jgi:radical SAM protein with 4Fe4S-binding SPASM domain